MADCQVCDNPAYMTSVREVAFSYFQENGFPTLKNEDWKYTPVKPYLRESFKLDTTEGPVDFNPETDDYFGKNIDGYKLFIIDGKLDKELSNFPRETDCIIQP